MHPLERDFEMSASEILDVIAKHNRCLIAVRGAIAEEHLERHLEALREQGSITEFTALDKDGRPDFIIPYRNKQFTVECKNVRKPRGKRIEIDIDFKRTRNPTGKRNQARGPEGRFYSPEEFDILAACLWNRTGQWAFAFVATRDLLPHRAYPDRLSDEVVVPYSSGTVEAPWSTNLMDILNRVGG